MTLYDCELRAAKDWRLRALLTFKRKVIKGCDTHPNGMSRLTKEAAELDIQRIRAEIKRRAALKAKDSQ